MSRILEAGLSKGRRDGFFWAVFLTIAIIGTITWLAIFEHNYHARIRRFSEDVTGDHARALKIVA